MKKQKSSKDAFDTVCWHYSIIADPYQVFAEAFSFSEMFCFLRGIKKILYYAAEDVIYREKSPSHALLYMKIIRSLIKAAYHLKEKKQSGIDVSEYHLFNKNYFCRHFKPSTAWEDFPRFLSVKEFCNPYLAFKKFFKYQSIEIWLHDWEEMVDLALSEFNGGQEMNMIAFYTYLSKLVEAAHLIDVREVNHTGGMLKLRWYGDHEK